MEVAAASSSSSKDGKAVVKAVGRSRKRRNICFALIALFLGVVLLFVILALTVFKAKRPVTTVNSVSLDDLKVSLDIPRLKVNLNLSLYVELTVKNPNKVGFKYTNSSARLNYRGEVVGEAPIPAGEISADGTEGINMTLTVMADRLLSNSQVYSDVISGTLPFTTYTRMSGKVRILKFIKIHIISETTCDITINISNRTVSDSQCHYKTKL